MSVTKSYNKHTDTYYAYETSYIWDEKLQKKVQKKTCIGQFDPDTGEVIPNARRGRPTRKTEGAGRESGIKRPVDAAPCADATMETIRQEILPAVLQLEQSVSLLARECETLKRKISMLLKE